jgi:hypothetical protein
MASYLTEDFQKGVQTIAHIGWSMAKEICIKENDIKLLHTILTADLLSMLNKATIAVVQDNRYQELQFTCEWIEVKKGVIIRKDAYDLLCKEVKEDGIHE